MALLGSRRGSSPAGAASAFPFKMRRGSSSVISKGTGTSPNSTRRPWALTTHGSPVNYRNKINDEVAKLAKRVEISPLEFADENPPEEPAPVYRNELHFKVAKVRATIFRTFEDPQSGKISKFLNLSSLVAIVISTITFVMESVPSLSSMAETFEIIEAICVSFFTFEYVSRLLTAPKTMSFIFNSLNIVDVLAIFPFYIELAFGGSDFSQLRVLRSVRLFRVFRVFKLGKHSGHFQMIVKTLSISLDALTVLVFIIVVTVIIFGGAIYYAEKAEFVAYHPVPCWANATRNCEHGAYLRGNGQFSQTDPFASIPASCWWAVVTFCTVGYGDAVPVTFPGKVIALLAMLVGILVVALPVTIVGANFTEVYSSEAQIKDLALKWSQTDSDFKDEGYLDYISRLQERRKRLGHLFSQIDRVVRETAVDLLGKKEARRRMYLNACQQGIMDNVIADLTTIEEYLLTLRCTTQLTRRQKFAGYGTGSSRRLHGSEQDRDFSLATPEQSGVTPRWEPTSPNPKADSGGVGRTRSSPE